LKDVIAAGEAQTSTDDSFLAEDHVPCTQADERRGVLVRVSPDLRRKLKIVAINRGVTVQDLMLEAIASIVEQPDRVPELR
jgi:hypothetical protein